MNIIVGVRGKILVDDLTTCHVDKLEVGCTESGVVISTFGQFTAQSNNVLVDLAAKVNAVATTCACDNLARMLDSMRHVKNSYFSGRPFESPFTSEVDGFMIALVADERAPKCQEGLVVITPAMLSVGHSSKLHAELHFVAGGVVVADVAIPISACASLAAGLRACRDTVSYMVEEDNRREDADEIGKRLDSVIPGGITSSKLASRGRLELEEEFETPMSLDDED